MCGVKTLLLLDVCGRPSGSTHTLAQDDDRGSRPPASRRLLSMRPAVSERTARSAPLREIRHCADESQTAADRPKGQRASMARWIDARHALRWRPFLRVSAGGGPNSPCGPSVIRPTPLEPPRAPHVPWRLAAARHSASSPRSGSRGPSGAARSLLDGVGRGRRLCNARGAAVRSDRPAESGCVERSAGPRSDCSIRGSCRRRCDIRTSGDRSLEFCSPVAPPGPRSALAAPRRRVSLRTTRRGGRRRLARIRPGVGSALLLLATAHALGELA